MEYQLTNRKRAIELVLPPRPTGRGEQKAAWPARGWPDAALALHGQEKLGPVALRGLSKHTGLVPEDL
jgi:hypothetical protein